MRILSPVLLSASLLFFTACKKELKDITLIAPKGTQIEYQVSSGDSGSLTIDNAQLNGSGEKVISINKEVESMQLLVTHPDSYRLASPALRVDISSQSSGKTFNPDVDRTSLRLAVEASSGNFHEANCKNLVSASASDGHLVINVTPAASVGDCDDEEFRSQDPLWAGHRDISKGSNYYDRNDDVRMGLDFVNEFNAKNGHLLVRDNNVQPYLQNVMNRIAANSDEKGFRPHVFFINADVVNAFALPGGPVYIFRGILEYVHDENELVAILGHEWAHVAARHGTRNVTKAINGQIAFLTAAVLIELIKYKNTDDRNRVRNELIAGAATLAAYGTTQAILMAGSREAEAEADKYGAQYSYRIGFSPNGIAGFFQKLLDNGSGNGTWLDNLFSDHPDHAARVQTNLSSIDRFYPREAKSLPATTPAFSNVRSTLRELPPMITGKAATNALGMQFIKINQDVSFKEVNSFFGKKFSK